MKRLLEVACMWIFLVAAPAWAATEEELRKLQTSLEQVFAMHADWVEIKIAFDEIAYPTQNEIGVRAEMAKLRQNVETFITSNNPKDAHEKLHLLKVFIYEQGPWNDNRPFSYDMADPLGEITIHKTLEHYLVSRKGNCITMSLLFAMLGQSIGLDMTVATAPQHVFVKFRDDDGKQWNIETTSGGGYTRNQHYRKQSPMSDLAVKNGVYLRAFDRKQSIALMAHIVTERLKEQNKFDEVLAATEVILNHDPKDVTSMVRRGAVYGLTFKKKYHEKYESFDTMPPEIANEARQLLRLNLDTYKSVEVLGWTEADGIKEKWPEYVPQPGEE
jgi:regulator of sirC expression with transglutaminase-like and TPR domain